MEQSLVVTESSAHLAGSVTYRCAACSELIDDEPVVAGDPIQTYHPEHVPQETPDGS